MFVSLMANPVLKLFLGCQTGCPTSWHGDRWRFAGVSTVAGTIYGFMLATPQLCDQGSLF